jgi:hypothetical protein
VGNPTHPEWLTVNIAAGGVFLTASSTLHGHVVAPAAPVVINANSTLNGEVIADHLIINSHSILRSPTVPAN